jgi:4-alpha-glucanotransferase
VPEGAAWTLAREDGGRQEGRGDTLPVLPLGLHDLTVGASVCTLISAPARLPLPPRSWGVMLPLHSLRPAETGGLADYTDLATAAEGLAARGADFLGLNPIHAGFWGDAGGFSPYTPSHRRRLSAFHLTDGERPRGSRTAHRLRRRDRGAAARTRTRVRGVHRRRPGPRLRRFRTAGGEALEVFCLHQALSDRFGPFWNTWPEALQNPDSPEVAALMPELREAMTFHAWLQWRAERELSQANARARARAWAWASISTSPSARIPMAPRPGRTATVSPLAPPSARRRMRFPPMGNPGALRPSTPARWSPGASARWPRRCAARWRCRVRCGSTISSASTAPSGCRRPVRRGPMCMPRAAMLAVVRMEAARAGAVVVGEDLGNVPRGLRGALEASGILGCRVMLFERGRGKTPVFRDPARYPARSIASFSTHDLPTWAGWRQGHDIDARLSVGDIGPGFAAEEHGRRQVEVAAFDAMTATKGGGDPASPDAMHRALGQSGSQMAMVQVENVLGIVPQPNLPGTTSAYPNWRQRLPVGPDALADDPGMVRTAAIMNAARGSPPRGRR